MNDIVSSNSIFPLLGAPSNSLNPCILFSLRRLMNCLSWIIFPAYRYPVYNPCSMIRAELPYEHSFTYSCLRTLSISIPISTPDESSLNNNCHNEHRTDCLPFRTKSQSVICTLIAPCDGSAATWKAETASSSLNRWVTRGLRLINPPATRRIALGY